MPDHDSITGRTETLDDWLEEWDHHGAWHTKAAEVQRLVDEIRRLRPISEAAQTLLDVLRSDPLLRSGESSIDQLDQWLKHKAAATGALRIALEGS